MNTATQDPKGGLLQAVKAALLELFAGPASTDMSLVQASSGFKMIGPDDRYWVAYWSNNAQDRDFEWFSQKAHDDYISRVDAGIDPLPSLYYWHEPAFKHGQALHLWRQGHVTVAVGEFDNSPAADAMKAYYRASKGESVSHGFFYPRDQRVDGVYHRYTTFEISPLPPEVAANPFTSFSSIEDVKSMSIDQQKMKALVERLGPDAVNKIIGEADTRSKELERLGVQFKEAAAQAPATNAATDAKMASIEESVKALATRMDGMLDALVALAASEKAFPPAKKGDKDPDKDGDDDSSPAGDTDKDGGSGKPGSAKKKEATAPAAIAPELAQMMADNSKMMAGLLEGQKAIAKFLDQQFAVTESAQRSQYTEIGKDNPLLATLEKAMTEGGQGGAVPGIGPENDQSAMAAQLFASWFGPNRQP